MKKIIYIAIMVLALMVLAMGCQPGFPYISTAYAADYEATAQAQINVAKAKVLLEKQEDTLTEKARVQASMDELNAELADIAAKLDILRSGNSLPAPTTSSFKDVPMAGNTTAWEDDK